MSCKQFKISMVAASVFAATTAHAALYKVVEVDPTASIQSDGIYDATYTEFYGSAIAKTTDDLSSSPMGCFDDSRSCPDYTLYGDSRNGSEGFSYRDEVPYNFDVSFYYTDWNRNRDYCRSELGYQTCDPAWTDKMWHSFSSIGGLKRERDAYNASEYKSNAQAFSGNETSAVEKLSVDPTSIYKPGDIQVAEANSANIVINNLDAAKTIGTTSSGYFKLDSGKLATAYRQRGYVFDGTNTTMLLPIADSGSDKEKQITTQMGRTMAWDSFTDSGSTYYVGSAAVGPFDYNDDNKNWGGDLNNCLSGDDPAAKRECQNFAFASKAAVWSSDGTAVTAISGWNNGTSRNVDKKAMQGSVRGAVVSKNPDVFNGKPVLVGLNSYQDGSNVFVEATVFRPNDTPIMDGNAWSPSRISRSTIKDGDDFIYSNSVATDINEHLVLIGEAKRRGDKRENGAAANRMFLSKVNSSGGASAQYFDELNGNSGIFFRGVGGKTGAINNFNEIVGAVDAEQATEFYGKKRRQRGFIYPYDTTGTDASRLAVFQGKPWLLDDLTNGGADSASNNKYRIIDAADINDDGVIAATALKCEPGYDSTGHNSYCGNGQTREKVVAVKLIPIANAADRSIVTRSLDSVPVERKGGSLGWIAMIFLGFLGLRRNK
ncbi:hypothetical protein BCU70_16040 [Vibrio sp. 10N.286.49.C2]|uniref:DUF3466 family protein n=1 Tax=unclassified Vibrio TaxID=2614977 RepID=UPI000C82124F|nr:MULTISPECIES: DUF3466 family protein [unclassified Vibrio]PMH37151.1 hypothetical protein BCU70_16040 [Vibrio sp. 10N.286.49.C2]PMH57296.1 hypothetical protein BCU66_04680 [Vibrio sp. 10N.286.49.B1]PMH83426.1 hypothetical protein BCU58_14820 [Vibrio sp. 10N.286.48.B7]